MQQLRLRVFTALAGLMSPWLAWAQLAPPAPGLARVHEFQDWAVACDNLRHCEAQGYFSQSGEALPVMLDLRRAAGPGAPVALALHFGTIAPDGGETAAPAPRAGQPVLIQAGALKLTLVPAGRPGEPVTQLPLASAQIPAVLAALRQAESLEARQGALRWRVSLKGASAALLKMDDLQGRIDTPGALARPGSRPEAAVPAPAAVPLISAQPLPAQPPADDAALRARLSKAVRALPGVTDACPLLGEPDETGSGEVWHLADGRVLVSLDCWRAAYNAGAAVWIGRSTPPHALQEVGFAALPQDEPPPRRWGWFNQPTGLSLERTPDGLLRAHAAAKGRGIGDCWSTSEWVWTGQHFALTAANDAVCRLFTPGGTAFTLWRAAVR